MTVNRTINERLGTQLMSERNVGRGKGGLVGGKNERFGDAGSIMGIVENK